MSDQAMQVTDDADDDSKITFDSQDRSENVPNYLITRSGNVIYKDV